MQLVGGVWTIGQIEVQKNRGLGKPATGSRPSRSTTERDTSDGGRTRRQDERECDRVQRRGSEEAFGISREDGYGWKSCCAGFGGLLHRKSEDRRKDEVEGEGGTYVFDVEYKDGEVDEFSFDSGAVDVWPQGRREHIPMMPKRSGLRMCAANGTEIQKLGREIVQFRGVKAEAGHSSSLGFTRRV